MVTIHDGFGGAASIEIQDSLPEPNDGTRWVGPIPPTTRRADPFPETPAGDEPAVEWAGILQPTVWHDQTVRTATSGRYMIRTAAGWYVAVPADRPSYLAGTLSREHRLGLTADEAHAVACDECAA
jgi:hypothetical protein